MNIKSKIMKFLYARPSIKMNMRKLSRELNSNHMSIKNNLEKLEKEGFVVKEEKELEHLYSLNLASEHVKLEKRLWNIKTVMSSGLIEYLDDLFESPYSIVVFGSFSFGEDNEGSDIDIAIQTSLQKEVKLQSYEKKLQRPIQVFTFDKSTGSHLKNSIYNGIVLKGRIQ